MRWSGKTRQERSGARRSPVRAGWALLALLGLNVPACGAGQAAEGASRAGGWGPAGHRPGLEAAIDSLVRAELDASDVVGMTVGVLRASDTLLLRGYGYADLEHRVRAGPATVYQIASVTKQFTEAAVLRLVERGLVDLDAPVERYVTAFPTRGRRVRIRELLNHTAGIPDYYDLPGWPRIRPLRLDHDQGREAMVGLVAAEPFDFEPGSDWTYSNAGYDLLGDVVEAVSGRDYWMFVDEELARPLGLERTGGCPWTEVVEDRARGYVSEDDGTPMNAHRLSQSVLFASGSLCSTARDLLAWNAVLHGGVVVAPELYGRMTTPEGAARSYGYGYGLRVEAVEDHAVYRHNGYAMGFASQLEYWPADELTVVVLANSPARVAGLADAIGRRVLGLPAAPQPVFPEGWLVRVDDGSPAGDAVFYRRMGAGVHATAGPAAVYYHPDSAAAGAFRVSGTFIQVGNPSPEDGHGLVLGVHDGGGPPAYVYFLVRGDGHFTIGRAWDGRTEPVLDWRRHETVRERGPSQAGRNELEARVEEDGVRFLVNGVAVATLEGAGLPPVEGIYGFRIGRDDDIHVADFGAGAGDGS